MTELHQNEQSIPYKSILIYGMGMMGASLAHALRASPAFADGTITGAVRSERSASFIREHRLADHILVVPSTEEAKNIAYNDYDLAVIGVPINTTIDLFQVIPENTRTLFTDMSSTRKSIHEAAEKRPDLRFVGAHPMCGSEDAGPAAARADLYHNRLCILMPAQGAANDSDRREVGDFWKEMGMHLMEMEPGEHDRVLAYLSHGPHILSGLMTLWADDSPDVRGATSRSPMPITGGGFRDMARIAGSNPEMWTDILVTNRKALADSLRDYRDRLDGLIEKVETPDEHWWKEWFSLSRKARNHLSGYAEDR